VDPKHDVGTRTGLSEAEAVRRLRQEGYNEIPSAKRHSILAIAWDVVREPMFLLLLACGTIYLLLGDVQEALMLLGFVFVVLGITLYQERKTERALEALRDLSSPRALVIRDGQRKRIAGRDVVRDDLIVVAEGDRVPCCVAVGPGSPPSRNCLRRLCASARWRPAGSSSGGAWRCIGFPPAPGP
jgi:Ca2+-transporting ATPase